MASSSPAAKKPPVKPGRPGFGAPRKPLTLAEQKARDRARRARLAAVTHPAPDDMKAITLELFIRTMHDGSIHPQVKCEAIKGRFDNPESKRFDMSIFDPVTVQGIVSRLSALAYATKVERRLPADSVYSMVLAARSDKDGNIGLSLRQLCYQRMVEKPGKKPVKKYVPIVRDAVKLKAKDENQLVLAKVRRGLKFLRGAFVNSQPIPAVREYKAMEQRMLGEVGEAD